eukprot:4058697-Ditylum_brightwellii.AAC.1
MGGDAFKLLQNCAPIMCVSFVATMKLLTNTSSSVTASAGESAGNGCFGQGAIALYPWLFLKQSRRRGGFTPSHLEAVQDDNDDVLFHNITLLWEDVAEIPGVIWVDH